jgi:hypothetical protein
VNLGMARPITLGWGLWLTMLACVGIAAMPINNVEATGAGSVIDLTRRLEALDPGQPMGYLELAEEIADGLTAGESPERSLARRLFGLAGRLDPEGLGSSAALGLASLAPNARLAERYRAIATLAESSPRPSLGGRRLEVDAATAMEVSEAFSSFRIGRFAPMRRVLEDPARRRLIRTWDQALSGGVDWLERESRNGGDQRPPLDRDRALMMIRIELLLLDRGRPAWSTLLPLEGDPPLLDLQTESVATMLLDADAASRPRYRNGVWVK